MVAIRSHAYSAPAGTRAVRGGRNAGAFVTSVKLQTAAATGTYPFTFGVGVRKGQVPDGLDVDLGVAQVVVKRRWNDGSVKHAIVSGLAPLSVGIPRLVILRNKSAIQPANTWLTPANIQAAAPNASITVGAYGATINLSSLLATPYRTWLQGPAMIECHYCADIPGSAEMQAWFHVRLYKDGRLWIRAIAENGYVDAATSSTVPSAAQSHLSTYTTVSISINGVVLYNNAGASFVWTPGQRFMAEGWIGGDPQMTVVQDMAYLRSTRLVPNYAFNKPRDFYLNLLTQTYTPRSNGMIMPNMGNAGYHHAIGIMAKWDSLSASSGDPRAIRSCLAHASMLNSYGMAFRARKTRRPIRITDFATWTHKGPNQGSDASITNPSNPSGTALVFDLSHSPSPGYLAYILTGDYWYLETMVFYVQASYLLQNPTYGKVTYSPPADAKGHGLTRLLKSQTRGTAWGLRNMGQLSAITPDGSDPLDSNDTPIFEEYRTWLANQYSMWRTQIGLHPASQYGCIYQYTYTPWGAGKITPWMTNFWVQSNGHIKEIEAIRDSEMEDFDVVRTHMYKWPIGLTGHAGVPDEYGYHVAAFYSLKVSPDGAGDGPGKVWYSSWGEIFLQTHGTANNLPKTAIEGTSAANPKVAPSMGYWGELLPALGYAVQEGVEGAEESWARFSGATNFSDIFLPEPLSTTPPEFPTMHDESTWGIWPRNKPVTV